MIITLTGTPGTGKSSVAEKTDYETIHLTDFLKELGIGEDLDNGELEVDINEMIKELENELNEENDLVIEGHLSHHYPADVCVVLRCQPEVLKKRLEKRDYSEEKIKENIESEALDLILSEAVDKQENVIEIDSTDRDPGDIAREIERKVENGETGYGGVDWSSYF